MVKQNVDVVHKQNLSLRSNENEKSTYVSVTSLVDRFKQPFDRDFWSAYKALEKLIPKDNWKIEKKSLLNTNKINYEILSLYDISRNDFNRELQNILDEWDKKSRDSEERGIKLHKELENELTKGGDHVSLKKYGIGGTFVYRQNQKTLDLEYGVYPEFSISYLSDDNLLKLVGRPDLIIKNGNEISIIDYKSCEKIDLTSGFNTITKTNSKMLYPLNNLMDCNFYHFSLQVSLYAYMIMQQNKNYKIKDLKLIHFDPYNKITIYDLDYLEDDVERLLKYYKKLVVRDKQKERLKRIEY